MLLSRPHRRLKKRVWRFKIPIGQLGFYPCDGTCVSIGRFGHGQRAKACSLVQGRRFESCQGAVSTDGAEHSDDTNRGRQAMQPEPSTTFNRSPWTWVPSLYFAEGIPYVLVMSVSVIMYKRLGISNTDIALYTSWLYLPWVIKPPR